MISLSAGHSVRLLCRPEPQLRELALLCSRKSLMYRPRYERGFVYKYVLEIVLMLFGQGRLRAVASVRREEGFGLDVSASMNIIRKGKRPEESFTSLSLKSPANRFQLLAESRCVGNTASTVVARHKGIRSVPLRTIALDANR